jgi:hypothetical protein
MIAKIARSDDFRRGAGPIINPGNRGNAGNLAIIGIPRCASGFQKKGDLY